MLKMLFISMLIIQVSFSFIFMELYRINYHRCSMKKVFFVRARTIRNFAKFTGKFTGLRSATLSKTRLSQGCFPVNFAKFLKAPLKNTFGWLLLTLYFIRFFSTAILLSSRQFTDVKHHLSISKVLFRLISRQSNTKYY